MATSKATTRARITETDAYYLGFLAKFPAADDEAMSYLTVRQANPFGLPEGELTQPKNIEKRFQKLIKMGAATKYRNPISGVRHYGVTPLGHQAAEYHGHTIPAWRGIDGLTISRLEHYRNIALIAAQFASPIGYFRDKLNIEPVTLEQLISEKEMAYDLEKVQAFLKRKRENGEPSSDFGTYRDQHIKAIGARIQRGEIDPAEAIKTYPSLLTVAAPETEKAKFKPIHQADLAVRLDDQTRSTDSPTAKNLLVEIELSQKSHAEYERILRTLKRDLATQMTYQRIIYFFGTRAIENSLKFADNNAGTNLIKTGHLVLLPIEGRTPHRARLTKRIEVPAGEPATVQTTPTPEPVAPRLNPNRTNGATIPLTKTPTTVSPTTGNAPTVQTTPVSVAPVSAPTDDDLPDLF